VVVDGITATIISDTNFSKADQDIIEQNAIEGLWPFYIPESNTVTFDENGMTIKTIKEPKKPFLLGALVLPISQYLGHAL
jgi:hypothetical protein